jgi:hypothetical protein
MTETVKLQRPVIAELTERPTVPVTDPQLKRTDLSFASFGRSFASFGHYSLSVLRPYEASSSNNTSSNMENKNSGYDTDASEDVKTNAMNKSGLTIEVKE